MIVTTTKEELEELEGLFVDALTTDGAHHKQWYLEKIAEKLGISIHDFNYDKGIAP
jgi:hypothetical protein